MSKLALSTLEKQLKKRLFYRYKWGQVQNNKWDNYTGFIYDTPYWDNFVALLAATHKVLEVDKGVLFDYAANRWFNFWSAKAIEQIFTEIDGIAPALNPRDRDKDFSIFGIDFDHKTSVFPKNFTYSFSYAQKHPRTLILWLYKNQSTEQRQHFKNRLFVIVHSKNGMHWKLKAEISLLKDEIYKYVSNFRKEQLYSINFADHHNTLSDVIWLSR